MIPTAACRQYPALIAMAFAAACGGSPLSMDRVLEGSWGGEGFWLETSAASASAVFTCAWGALETPIRVDRHGYFEAPGSYVREVGPASLPNPATYEGRVRGSTIELTVLVTDTLGTGGTFTLGPFEGAEHVLPLVYYCQ